MPSLTLEVTGRDAEPLGPGRRAVFGVDGGTIGRGPDSTWVLPHSMVSTVHAHVRCSGGVFYLEDRSTNGTFITTKKHRMRKGEPYALSSGMVLLIEPYKIHASLAATDARGPYAGNDQQLAGPIPGGSSRLIPDEEIVDPIEALFGGKPKTPPPSGPRVEDFMGRSPLEDAYRPPAISTPPSPLSPAGGLIPDDYDPAAKESWVCGRRPVPSEPQRAVSAADPREPVPWPEHPAVADPFAPTPPRPSRARHRADVAPPAPHVPEHAPAGVAHSAGAAGDLLQEVLQGAGLRDALVTPQLARNFGEILRVVVSGVMSALQARQEVKDEFRIRTTRFKPADNNPLKFSANVDDALHNLLVKRNAAYLEPVPAFEDAFNDLRRHQMAMLAGVRVAFETLLAEFDPAALAAQFDRQAKKGSVLGGGKPRYWEQYCERLQAMNDDREATFRRLFGERFVKAYEDQMDRLSAAKPEDKL